MVLLSSLKVLSSGTRYTVPIAYTPPTKLRNEFLFPAQLPLVVEVFPIGELTAFAQSEPVYAIDGYLIVEQGHPKIIPCSVSSFADFSYAGTAEEGPPVSLAAVTDCVKDQLPELIATALRKAESAFFEVRSMGSLQTFVFLVKMGCLATVRQCLHEDMGPGSSLAQVLPYLIYEVFCQVTLDRESPLVIDRLLQLASALGGSLSALQEDRVINCLIVGLKLSLARRPAKLLELIDRARVSPGKKSLFFFLISKYLGSEHSATRCGLVARASDAFVCQNCSPSSVQGVKNSLQAVVELESSLQIARPACDHALDEYLHAKSDTPSPEITLHLDLGVATGEQHNSVFVPAAAAEPAIDRCTGGWTEGRVELRSTVVILGITVALEHPRDILTLSEDVASVSVRQEAFLSPVYYQNGKYVFFLAASGTITQIHLKHKNRAFVKTVHAPLQVITAPISPRLYDHRYLICPVVLTPHRDAAAAIAEQASALAGLPVSVVANEPTVIRAMFNVPNSSPPVRLYKDIVLDWTVVEIAKVTLTENSFNFSPLFKPLLLTCAGSTTPLTVSQTFSVQKAATPVQLEWVLCDKTKSGTLLLK